MAQDAWFPAQEHFRCTGVTVVKVRGEVDLTTSDHMRDRILRAARDSRCTCLVVDMSGIDFFGACGVGALVAVHRELTRQGRHMALAEPTPIAARVLNVLGMEQLFDVYPLVEMALTHTGGPRIDGACVTADPGSKVP